MGLELICKKRDFTGKDGKEKVGYNYYLRTESGSYIAIKPVFNDYSKLRVLAKCED